MPGLRGLYNWALRQAERSHAPWLLFFMALIEPCFLPIPPDILLIPMAIAQRAKAFRLAAVATVGSVIGGVIGYGIGALAMATIGQWVVSTYHLENAFLHFHNSFNKYGMWIILAKGLTPIPFILVALASGVAHLNLLVFVLSATVTRGARFFIEAVLIYFFGEPIRIFLERHLTWVALAVLAAIGFGFWIVLR
jgi:membrane protein YqaA with SNARE-associated domain